MRMELAAGWECPTAHNLIPNTRNGRRLYVDSQNNGNEPKTFRVAVVNFDPYCPGHSSKSTHQAFGWSSPRVIAEGYINDLATTSGVWCNYRIVDWYDADYPHSSKMVSDGTLMLTSTHGRRRQAYMMARQII